MTSNRALQYIEVSEGIFGYLGASGYFWKDHNRVTYDKNAERYLEIDKNLPFSHETEADSKNLPSPTLAFLSEALIQATFLMILRKDWLQQNERNFIEYVSDRYETLFGQIRTAIKASSKKESERLFAAIQEACRFCLSAGGNDNMPPSLELAFDAVKKQELLLKFSAELARQISSRIVKGELVEKPSSILLDQQSIWLQKTIKSVRILLPVSHVRGRLFAKTAALLDEIDKDFDKFPVLEEHLHRSLISE